jgi:hypothetical protein
MLLKANAFCEIIQDAWVKPNFDLDAVSTLIKIADVCFTTAEAVVKQISAFLRFLRNLSSTNAFLAIASSTRGPDFEAG